jgi:hypothetical protein
MPTSCAQRAPWPVVWNSIRVFGRSTFLRTLEHEHFRALSRFGLFDVMAHQQSCTASALVATMHATEATLVRKACMGPSAAHGLPVSDCQTRQGRPAVRVHLTTSANEWAFVRGARQAPMCDNRWTCTCHGQGVGTLMSALPSTSQRWHPGSPTHSMKLLLHLRPDTKRENLDTRCPNTKPPKNM